MTSYLSECTRTTYNQVHDDHEDVLGRFGVGCELAVAGILEKVPGAHKSAKVKLHLIA